MLRIAPELPRMRCELQVTSPPIQFMKLSAPSAIHPSCSTIEVANRGQNGLSHVNVITGLFSSYYTLSGRTAGANVIIGHFCRRYISMRVTIIGIGLIGGSLGMALKRARWPGLEVVGFARRADIGERAVGRGAIDRFDISLGAAVGGSDVVVVCTPVLAVEEVFVGIRPYLSKDCVVTDTASTKQQVMTWADKYLRGISQFVGGHPMAGRERSGMDAADPELFRGCTYCVVPTSWSDTKSVDLVERFVKTVGGTPLHIQAEKHDYLVAGVSHLPTVLSAALVEATSSHPEWPLMAKLAASGYRDVTRLASGNARMSADMFVTNRVSMIQWIDRLESVLAHLKVQITDEGPSLEATLLRICQARERWIEFKSGRTDAP